ncbi:MAG: hypothetical protein CMM50_01760 [Rhodospirillaceae bacterium]|nr:hypothetical protein [Rhodospirillaceae bacterium]
MRKHMTILEEIRRDHERAKALLETIVEGHDNDARLDAFKEFSSLISAHNQAETEILYRAMEKNEESRFIALEGEEEHDVADRLLESLKKSSSKTSDRWLARAKVLKELLEHHVEEEEDEAFDKAEEVFSREELEAMGGKFTARKKELM